MSFGGEKRDEIRVSVSRSPEDYGLRWMSPLGVPTDHGYLNIDNNAAERALKRVAIGRKNWLFAGHDEAGASHARLYTLVASAERHGIDPQKYLTSVLAKIEQTRLSELDQFLPDVWKAEDHATPPSATALSSAASASPPA
jgi:transposase